MIGTVLGRGEDWWPLSFVEFSKTPITELRGRRPMKSTTDKLAPAHSGRCLSAWLTAAGLAMAAAFGVLQLDRVWTTAAVHARPVSQRDASNPKEPIIETVSLSETFRSAAKKVIPAVVELKSPSEHPAAQWPRPGHWRSGDAHADEFINNAWGERQSEEGLLIGSGVIVAATGIVLTNSHVVEDVQTVIVCLADGRRLKTADITADAQTDLAVLRVAAEEPLPSVRLGDSRALEIGDWVLAVGSPFELAQTVSAGIISAKNRTVDPARRARLLQTDAAINPGSSGGPLVDLNGELVGITTAIASRDGGYQGIGFAVPAHTAKWVMDELLQHGKVRRSSIGASFEDIPAARAKSLELPRSAGVLVNRVFDAPGDAATVLQEGDVILTIDGSNVGSAVQLEEIVERTPVGSTHRIGLLRAGKQMEVQVLSRSCLEYTETGEDTLAEDGQMSELVHSPDFGLVVANLSETKRSQTRAARHGGVLVHNVDREGVGYRSGIRKGMILFSVNGRRINNIDEFADALESQASGSRITFGCLRSGKPLDIPMMQSDRQRR